MFLEEVFDEDVKEDKHPVFGKIVRGFNTAVTAIEAAPCHPNGRPEDPGVKLQSVRIEYKDAIFG